MFNFRSLWNHFDHDRERTTNHVEAWHSKINRKAKCQHPNIYKFIGLLQNEEKENKATRMMLDAGHPPTKSSEKYLKKNERLQKLKLKLLNNQITLSDYMNSLISFSSLKN